MVEHEGTVRAVPGGPVPGWSVADRVVIAGATAVRSLEVGPGADSDAGDPELR